MLPKPPHLETTYKYFVSFHPTYRRNLIRLAAMVNEELRAMVEALNHEFVHQTEHIQLRYSNALAPADLSRAELLHPIDGWHASDSGGRSVQRFEAKLGLPWNRVIQGGAVSNQPLRTAD